jgi:hypothetical protein
MLIDLPSLDHQILVEGCTTRARGLRR